MKRFITIALTAFFALSSFASPLLPEEDEGSTNIGGVHDKPHKVLGVGANAGTKVNVYVSGNTLLVISSTPLERAWILIVYGGSGTMPYRKMVYLPTGFSIITLPQYVADTMQFGQLSYSNGSVSF
jgi:hypothetical protein